MPGPIVVTGADGFVGSALVAQFVATGRSFVAVVRQYPAGAAAKPIGLHEVSEPLGSA